MDGALRVKLSPAGAGGVLCNGMGDILIIFSKPIDICDSIEAEVLAILKALRLYSRYCNEVLCEVAPLVGPQFELNNN